MNSSSRNSISAELPIKGIRALSLIDYPKKLSAVVFFGGCNFRCPFCHNLDIAVSPQDFPTLAEDKILEELSRRKKMLDGVVLTGGEPTLYPAVAPFAEKLKKMGYSVKLDTNGYRPEVLQQFIEKNIADFISMDIKAPLETEKYSKASGTEVDVSLIRKSMNLLMQGNVPYEFRTTVIKEFLSAQDILSIGKAIKESSIYYLQPANKNHERFPGYDEEEMKEMVENLRKIGVNAFLR
jgi:pyruvate formate lyase activating enzyme